MMARVPTAAGSPWARLWRGVRRASDPFDVGHGPLSPANGLRAGVIFLVPFLLALPGDTLDGSTNVGIAGLLVTLTDVGGPRRVRMQLMALSTLWVTVAVVLGVLVGVGPVWLQVLLLLVLVAGVTTWSAIGAVGITAGLAATLAAISGLAYQDSAVAWEIGAQFAVGGAWAIAVALAMPWVNPERRALRRTQAALAGVADHLDAVRGAGRATAAASEAAAAQALNCRPERDRRALEPGRHRGQLAPAAAGARGLAHPRRRRGGRREAGRRSGGRARMPCSTPRRRRCARWGSRWPRRTSASTSHGSTPRSRGCRARATAPSRTRSPGGWRPPRRRASCGMPRCCRCAGSPAATRWARRRSRAGCAGSPCCARLLSPRSMVFRYAVRLGAAVALAYGIGVAINPDYGQLAAVAAIPVLQPNVGGTLREALKHSLSVIILIALAVSLVIVVDDADALSVIATVLVIGVFALERMSFGAFVVLLAPLAVIIAGTYEPAHGAEVALEVAFALLGAAVAIVVGYLVFRGGEERALPTQIAAALATARALLACALDPSASPQEVAGARVDAEIARINAGAAVMRAQGEHRRPADQEPYETILASDAELIDAAVVVGAAGAPADPSGAWATRALTGLERAAARGSAPDPLPPRSGVPGTDAVSAVVRAVEGIDDAMRRLARSKAAARA